MLEKPIYGLEDDEERRSTAMRTGEGHDDDFSKERDFCEQKSRCALNIS